MPTFRRWSYCRGWQLVLAIEGASSFGDRISATPGQFGAAAGCSGRNMGFL